MMKLLISSMLKSKQLITSQPIQEIDVTDVTLAIYRVKTFSIFNMLLNTNYNFNTKLERDFHFR